MSASPVTAPGVLTPKRPFGIRDKVGYMFGDFGNDFTFILQAAFFMVFFTNVVGIDPAHVGTLLLVARVCDGFTDVGMGVLVDRLPLKVPGTRFRRWIKYICVPVAVASVLMYMSFVADFGSYGLKVVWMCATYFLWGSVTYTAINIPYGSMSSVVSPDPDDRAELSVWRSTGATLANIAIMTVLPLVVYKTNAEGQSVLDGPSMTMGAAVCSVLAVACYLACYFLVEERVDSTPAKGEQMGIGSMLAAVFSNRALLGLIAAALLLLVSMLFGNGMLSYLFLNYFGNGKIQSVASMASLAPTLALVLVAPWLSRRFGKAEVGIVAMSVGGVLMITAYVLKIESATTWIIFYAVAMFAMACFNFLVWAFITDVIDYQEVRTGERGDGTVYAVYSWSRKLGQALAGGLTGWALGWIGYDTAAATAGHAQSGSVVDGIYMLSNLVPGIGYILVALAILLLYPLKKKVVEANNAVLAERRAAAKVA
ncbi:MULTISPECIES: glycoside-pentoside-hexuronide (GPH):cation symporter [unclassified Actinomyces]|nr:MULTISPECIES: glycoside-pentoside-hexuronide (GPH):cation symporter [unclassified Actinomyces]MCL3778272.1 MFS transporter [Actinomyces sp. AC-20-1]MCL3788734.1 MFS transporter [Actinomyces sp. 187325]MCL3791792.1 MFS transporter [Actinomyces sp. 186855]MCL3794364.1 MFS transporter [Actinomyces sp. 217892]